MTNYLDEDCRGNYLQLTLDCSVHEVRSMKCRWPLPLQGSKEMNILFTAAVVGGEKTKP